MKTYIILLFILATLTVDFLSKLIAQTYIKWIIPLLNDIFFLENVKNSWVAFSINLPFIKFFTIFLIIWIIYYYIKYEKIKKSKIIDFCFALIIWWSLGNARERIFLWSVSDFIWVKYFAIFNLADSFLCIWVALLIFQNLLKK